MNYEQFILTVNTSSIVILLILALLLLMATHFKGEAGYAAAIIAAPTIPIYLYNTTRMLCMYEAAYLLFPFALSLNTLLMPLLWLFTRRNFNADFRISLPQLLHLLPMIFFLVLSFFFSRQEILIFIRYETMGNDLWFADLNSLVVTLQILLYFPLIFFYIYKERRLVGDVVSDAEWAQKAWIGKFMILFAALFVVVMVSYVIWPRTDAWLIQILNLIAMFFLVYNAIVHPTEHKLSVSELSLEPLKPSAGEQAPLTALQMEQICSDVSAYLEESKAYLRPEYSLAALALEVKIPQRNISRSINSHMKCNFFTLINRLRVEEAKRLLLNLDASGYTIDSISQECGFRSRSTFFLVFKKLVGQSPAAWLSVRKKEKKES